MSRWRTLLNLGRVSNLPTVWSNCLAGWWLGGGGNLRAIPWLLAGATLLYTGGMFLNDAFDVEFDRQRRKERPIPSGAISAGAVWFWGFALLAAGEACLLVVGLQTAALGLTLLLCIVVYDAVHKLVAFSPALMGFCRLLLYLVAASTGADGITGRALWCALALAVYVVGLSYMARVESTRGPIHCWPVILLAAPVVLALFMNAGPYRNPALLLAGILALWILRSLRPALWSAERRVGRTVAHLLAGIVLVDLLAVADLPRDFAWAFFGLFGLALVLQRFVPAT